ncbi:hypothetical protein CWIS_01315 [Cellulomonas sp. A375-1]|uniref:prepilin-type N-terminal cleavage/methylation domain-containing protein n=1 Tax=Cellulomonas TaxID=1707 RepID=UPI0006527FCC|nr:MULTISPECIES: prepilin-type N-terminal cleavage/methylation domain-containing protein [Cellulomonas]KMM47149.1 hypothetical protein CWIS_01315 [Cellulomonas sp. A375-1]MCR6703336.1 prepilin-type N-terminal cleavage/methylation domain-containing protein [Cellulomonas sp.]
MAEVRPPTSEDDSGFTLMELLVAMIIIGGVLLGLAAVQTSALVTTAQTRQRTLGTAVTNQVMEQLRALPWNTLNKGLHAGFASADGVDPNVSGTHLRPPMEPSIDEVLITSTAQATNRAPLSGASGSNVTRTSNPEAPGIRFTSRSYVTRAAADPDVLTLTVITTWKANQQAKQRHVVMRSSAYAPQGGCGDANNQPYLGACQALFSSSAGGTGPQTTITAAFGGVVGDPAVDSTTPILPGTDTTVASLRVGQAGVGVTAQQSTNAESSALHASGALTAAGATDPSATTGGDKAAIQASNDVGSAGAAPLDPAPVTSVGVAGTLAVDTGPLRLALTPGSGDQGKVSSSTVTSCATGIPAAAPCAASVLTSSSPSVTALTITGTTFELSRIGSSSMTTFGARLSTAVGASAIGCTTLSGPGCTAAGASRSLGTVTSGSGPWSGGKASSGLLQVTSYTDATRVDRGLAQRTSAAVTTRSGSVRYWNGSAYTTVTLSGATNITANTGAVTWASGAYTVTASGQVSVTPVSSLASAADPAGCTGEGCSISSETGAITLAVHYRVTGPSGTFAFVVTTSLGGARAAAGFKAAPGA